MMDWNSADQQTETDLTQIAALLLIMPALRQFSGGAGIDVGEEISAVVDQGAEIQVKTLDEALGNLLFAFQDVLGGDQIHMVPEVLGRQRGRVDGALRNDDRAVIFTAHGRAVGEYGVRAGDVRIRVHADRRGVELAHLRPFVERLNIAQDVIVPEVFGRHAAAGKPVEHERVVGVG